MNWRPGAGLEQVRARAALLRDLRSFFAERNVLEVETPLLCTTGVTDTALEPMVVPAAKAADGNRYLQTSPEYGMKRLLAAGIGPIYQIGKAFRRGELGARHNPEFSLLEWYRPGFDHHTLMSEVVELATHCLGPRPLDKRSYRQWFLDLLDTDPFTAPVPELENLARTHTDVGALAGGRDLWLDLLMSHVVEPQMAALGMCLIYDYPASQAALSRVVDKGGVMVGQRFELFVDGMELANGYFELTDAREQRARFEQDNERLRELQLEERALDENLLSAMEHGLPACSGVAMGLDRLLMLVTGKEHIRDILTFDWTRS